MVAIRGMSISFLTGGCADVAPRRLGDVDGEVADALEIGVDLHGRDDRAQVDGHRLVERQQREAAVVDLDVQRVERLVAGEHALDQLAVAVDQALDREAHLLLGQAAHLEQAGLELLELFLKMPDAGSVTCRVLHAEASYPNRPVT